MKDIRVPTSLLVALLILVASFLIGDAANNEIPSLLTSVGAPSQEPPIATVTATVRGHVCRVTVGQNPVNMEGVNTDLVWLLRDNNGLPGTAKAEVPLGTSVLVTRFYVVQEVTEEYSYAEELGGWIRNSKNFPAYDYQECWDVPVTRPTPTATPAPTATALKATFTPVPVVCQVAVKAGLDFVNVRALPNLTAYIEARMLPGDRAVVNGVSGDWYKVKVSSGAVGWVANWVVDRSAGCQ